MNLCDCYVTEVLKPPFEAYGKWWVSVRYESWGTESETSVMCGTLEEAERIEAGYTFLA